MPNLMPRLARTPLFLIALSLIGALGVRLAAQRLDPGATETAPEPAQLAAPGPVFAIEPDPERLATGGWRLSWSSIPGRRYLLQRWTSDDMAVAGSPPWSDLAMVVSTGTRTSADDPSAVLADRRFYRVALLPDDGADLVPPSVSAIAPRYTASSNRPAARLSVSATDNVGVTRVEFFNATQPLGSAVRGTSNTWSLTMPLDLKQLGARFLVARAFDAAGNFANSPVFPLGLVDPEHFVPLGPDGSPVEGGVVPAVSVGAWGPVEFRPGGRDLFGRGAGFFVRFPSGVRLLQIDGRPTLEFTNAVAGFSAGYPLQLTTSLQRTGGSPRRLPVDRVQLADVLSAFDLDPTLGVRIRLFDRFEMVWRAGAIEDGRLVGVRFSPADLGLPLPEISGDFPEWRIEFASDGSLRLPFHGEFALPDGSGIPARLVVGRGSPLWLSLHPDGRIEVEGSAGLELGNGGSFRADLRLDDPYFHLSMAADRLRWTGLSALGPHLPTQPGACLPASRPGEPAALAQATLCLVQAANAYRGVASGLTALGASTLTAQGTAASGVPAEPAGRAAGVLEAWAATAERPDGTPLPFAAIRALVLHAAASAAESHDLPAAAHLRLALHRLAVATASGRFDGGTASLADLNAALAEADAAILLRLDEPAGAVSAAALAEGLRYLADTEPLRQQLGRPGAATTAAAIDRALGRFAATLVTRLGTVRSGEFTSAGNPTVAALPRAAAAGHLRTLAALVVAARGAGANPSATILDEAIGQLALRVATSATADLAAAEGSGDYPRFLRTLLDLVELVELRRAGALPEVPALATLPVAADLPALVSRLGTLLSAELEQPLGERSLAHLTPELRSLLRLFRATPGTLPIAGAALRRPFDQIELHLAADTSNATLPAETRVSKLAELLEAGTLHAEYARRTGLTPGVDWETARLPRVAAVLATRAAETGAWSELDRAARLLLDTASGNALAALPGPRRAILDEAARLIDAARATARAALGQATSAEGPTRGLVDLALPGSIAVHEAAGSVRYERLAGALEGSFRGILELPGLGNRLVVHRALLGSAGRLELQASGDLRVPEASPFLSASIPASDPFHLRWSEGDGLRLSGGANVTLANGMFFRGSLGLEDPVYRFRLEAGGLQVQLARTLSATPAPFPADAAFNLPGGLDETGLELWSDYLGQFDATLGALGHGPAAAAPVPGARSLLERPAPPVDLAASALRTWSRLGAIERRFGGSSNALASLRTAAALFQNRRSGTTLGNGELDRALDPNAGRRTLAGPAALSSPPLTLSGALQFDLGGTVDTVPVPGPAQDLGRFVVGTTAADIVLPDLPGAWNAVDGFTDPAIRFADGTPATGIRLVAGPGLNADSFRMMTNELKFAAVRGLFLQPAPTAGVYTNDILADALTGHTGPADDSSVVVHVKGLPPGDYLVFAMVSGVSEAGRRFSLHAGGSSTHPSTWARTRIELPRRPVSVTSWQEGLNFTRSLVALRQPGEDLVVVSRTIGFFHSPDSFEFNSEPNAEGTFSGELFVDVPGEISGLQIVPVRPSVVSFAARPDRVELGHRTRLEWSVRHASRVVVTGSDGSRFESTSGDDDGFVEVEPAGPTTYTLTASNANGSPATGVVSVRALGSDTLTNTAADAAEDLAGITEELQELADQAALCELQGGTNCPDLATVACATLGPFLDAVRANLLDCEAVKGQPGSRERLIQAIQDALQVSLKGASESLLAGCPEESSTFSLADVEAFATCVLQEYYRRTGADVVMTRLPDGSFATEATLRPEAIDAFVVAESTAILRELMDLQSTLNEAGSQLNVVHEHLAAHAGNIARRTLTEVPSRENAEDPRFRRTDSEYAHYLEGILMLHDVRELVPEVPTLPRDTVREVILQLLDRSLLKAESIGIATSVQGFFDRGIWLPILETIERGFILDRVSPEFAIKAMNRSVALRAAEALREGSELSSEVSLTEFLAGRGSIELRPRDVRAFRILEPYLPSLEFSNHLSHRVLSALEYIEDRIPNGTGTFNLDELRRRADFVGQLADLQLLLEGARTRGTPLAIPPFLQPLTLGSNLLVRARDSAIALGRTHELVRYSRAVFNARRNLKLSLTTLRVPDEDNPASTARASRVLAGAAPTPDPETERFGAELVRLTRPLLRDAAQNVATQARAFATNATANLPGDLALPASLRVDRVFGEFHYNRLTGFLRGGFGGDLAFPDAGITASIREASAASDGSFAIDAATAGPLPFGRIRLESALRLDFATNRGTRIAGSGQLHIPTATSTQSVAVAVSFDEATRRLAFEASDRNLQLPLSEDFVIFDLGGGLVTEPGTSGAAVRLTGSVGMMARSKPLPASVTRSNFLLTVDNAAIVLGTREEALEVRLEGGTLRLPEHFSAGACATNVPGLAAGPSIALNATNPIVLTLPVPGRGTPSFRGELAFSRLGLQVPGLTNISAEICTATLRFPSNALPRLSRVNATLAFALPGATNHLDLVDAEWGLDGFPTGTLALRETLPVFDQAGFALRLLGTSSSVACPAGTALSIGRNADGSPFFRLDGGFEFAFPASVLGSTNGGQLAARSCGVLAGSPGRPPEAFLESIALAGSFRLGGAQGLLIENGEIALQGLTNLFAATASRPFVVRVSGEASIPSGPRLGLQDAKFEFMGEPLPRFSLRGLSLSASPTLDTVPGLPIAVTAASFQFFNPSLPLPGLLHPTNIVVGLSATAHIPPGPDPVISGTVRGLTASLRNGRLEAAVNGIGISFADFEVPPLSLTGEVFIGGLDAAGADATAAALAGPGLQARPDGPYFAGRVGGTLNGIGVKALVALDLQGPIGVCLDGSAGPAGIPLGPTGFLLTGVQGGVSFLNSNGDPCDFATFIPLDASGRPASSQASLQSSPLPRPAAAMSWQEYRKSLDRQKLAARVEQRLLARVDDPGSRTAVLSGPELAAAPEFPCPTGDCPPASVNILCQPHPDTAEFPDAIIMKFSALDTDTLDRFGITRAFVEGLGATPAAIASGVARQARSGVNALIPRADPALLGATLAADLNRAIDEQLGQFEATLDTLIRQALGGAAGASIYARVVETAARGVPCPDATVKLTGTFSHAAVSTALSGTVGVVLSSAGSAGIVGSLNVTGIPVGTMRSFVNLTDAQGLPNPSYCGDAQLALGPIEFGQVRARFECPGCVTGFLGAFGQLASCLGETQTAAVLRRVAPRLDGRPVAAALGALTDSEKMAFAAHVFSQPPVPGLAACWRDAARGALESFNPSYVLCGAAQPRIFGIPLGDSALEIQAAASRTGIAAGLSFSPTYIINNLALCGATLGGACTPIFPALDSAQMGFSVGFPDPVAASLDGLGGKLSSPEALGAYVRDGFAHLLANSTITLGYQLNPFGLKLADGEGRVVLPNLTAHPARPGAPAFVPPENRGLPSRLDLLLAALQADLIANPLWRGTTNDLHLAFPEGSPQRAALQGRNLSFATDYFPHGGFLGAGRIALPKLLVDAPPAALGVVFDGSRDPLTRLGAAADVVGNHLLQTANVGTLAFYVPAPNPPFFSDAEGQPLDPQRLLEAIGRFDIAVPNLANPYPFEVGFLQGRLDGRLLGVPIARATVTAQPAAGSSPAFFRVAGEVPTNSWLQSFVASASLNFEIRQAPPLPIDVFFADVQSNLQRLASQPSPAPDALLGAVRQLENGLADAMPKVSMELGVSNLRIPDALTNLLTTANASATLFAYSPRFAPDTTGTNPVAFARRNGGLAFRGNFRFADLVTIDNAELAVLPKLNPVEPPALSGLLNAARIPLPGLAVHDVAIQFNTEPPVGLPFFAARGAVDPIVFANPLNSQPLLSIRPLAPGATRIAASVNATRISPTAVAASLSIDPARIDMPILGPDLSIRVHGASASDPFTFSTTGSWTSTVSITGSLSLRDLNNQELLRVGAAGQPFSARLAGDGLAFRDLQVAVPGGLTVTVFPAASVPEGIPRTFTLGTAPATLRISSDGTFAFDAALGGAVNLASLPAPALDAGAALSINPSRLTLTGRFNGGLLAPGTSANGTFTLTSAGQVTLTGSATLPPQSFGSLQLQGVSTPELQVALFHDGYAVPNGARLRIVGVASDLLALSPFTNRANADFTARVTSGAFAVPNAFRITGGRMELRRRAGTVTFDIDSSPELVLLPGSTAENRLAGPFTSLSVSTEGRFYADSGTRELRLPGEVVLAGRLEIGNEPGTGTASLAVDRTTLDFATIDFGSVTSRVIRLTNNGQIPLVAGLTSSSGSFIPALADVSLGVGRSVDVPVEFRPATNGTLSAQLQITRQPGGATTTVALAGTARAVPVLAQVPLSLTFPETAVGSPRTRTLIVRNSGTAPLILTNAVATGPFSVSPAVSMRTLAPGASLPLEVTFRPTAPGSTSGTVVFTANTTTRLHTNTLAGTGFTQRWILAHAGGPTLRAVAFRDALRGWAVGDDDTVLQTDDGGHSWRRVNPRVGGEFRAIAVEGDTVVVGGADGILARSTDAGTNWLRITSPIAGAATNHWNAIAIHPGNVLAGTPATLVLAGARSSGGGVLARETGSGFVVASLPAEPLHAVAQHRQLVTQPGRFMAVGDGGRILRSTDGGSNWTSSTTLPSLPLRGVVLTPLTAASTDPQVLLVGDSGVFLRASSFTGTLQRTLFNTRDFRAAASGLAVGLDAFAVRPGLVGLPPPGFQVIDPDGAYDLYGVARMPTGHVAVGAHGQIWILPENPPTGPFLAISDAALDFGTLPSTHIRSIELTLANRGVATLHVSNILVSGSSAFSVSRTSATGIATNSAATVTVRFNPVGLGRHVATLELVSNDANTRFRVPLVGHAQANEWPAIASPDPANLADLTLVSDTLAFAATSSRVLRSSNSGTNWAVVTGAPGTIHRLHFVSTTLGFATGGEVPARFGGIGACTNDCQSFILRTADGGNTWSSRPTGVGTRVADIEFGSSTIGYAVTRSESDILGRVTPGSVLKTTNGGQSWTQITRPVPASGSFDGTAVEAVSSIIVFVASGAELFRSADGGSTWTRVLTTGTSRILDLQFTASTTGFLVGENGLFRRTTSSGTSAATWIAPTAFTTANLSRVHFLGGLTGWAVGSDASTAQLFRTLDAGNTWVAEIRKDLASGLRGPTAVTALATTRVLAADGASVVRSSTFAPPLRGSPVLPELVDLGTHAVGATVTNALLLRNLATTAVVVSGITLADDSGTDAFDLLAPATPFTVGSLGTASIPVRFRAPAHGRHAAVVAVVTDGHEGTLASTVVADARVFPTPVQLATEPPGLTLLVDGSRPVTTPGTFTVVGPSNVPDDTINPFEWRFGTVHTLEAPATQVRGGYEYAFQGWEPAVSDRILSVVATNVPATYRAIYVPVRTLPVAGGEPALAGDRRLAAGPPTDVGVGPYVRVSNARLRLPGLGEPAVSGAAFLASDRFQFTLANAPLGNPALLSVSAGSWRVSYTNAPFRFVVRAGSPGVTVLNTPAQPPAEILFDVTASAITAQVDTQGHTPIVPGIAEIGPSRLTFSSVAQGGARFSSFSSSTSLRALALPGGGFAVTNNLVFRASDGPFTNRITTFPSTLLATPLFTLRPGTSPAIEFRRDANGTWGASVQNFSLSLAGGAASTVSGSLNGSRITLTTGRTLGLGSLVYNADAPGSLEWNFAGPSLRATLPAGSLSVPGVAGTLRIPQPLVFDTAGSFDVKLPLPTLEFDGMSVSGGGDLDHNFVRFYRVAGVAGFQLRDRRTFFDNTFKLAMDVNTAGTLSGSFRGELVLRDFLGCEEIGLGDIRLEYRNAPPFQFSGRVRGTLCSDLGADFQVQFGSGGGRVCHLICNDSGCAESVCLSLP